MNVNNASLLITAVKNSQFPELNLPEIAFVGRSNVGKSSLINTLINRKSLARTSGQPGKTRTINFYNIEDKLLFVDLPGYGYAKVSKEEQGKWSSMIEGYLKNRDQLICIVMIVDIRHEPTSLDIEMYEWLKYFGYKTIIVSTKADKVSKSFINQSIAKAKKILELGNDDKIIAFSAENRYGKEELWKVIDNMCDFE